MKTLGEAADLTGGKVQDPSGAGTDPNEFLVGLLIRSWHVRTQKESGKTTMKRQLIQQAIRPPQSNMFNDLLSMTAQYGV
jgi:hypothetical protein